MGKKCTEAQKRASIKCMKARLDDIHIRPPKGTKERWKNAAADRGESLIQFVTKAVEAGIKHSESLDTATTYQLILDLRSDGWTDTEIINFILWIETGDSQYQQKHATADDLQDIRVAREEYARGETISFRDINWN